MVSRRVRIGAAASRCGPFQFDVLATLRRSGKHYTLSPIQLYEALIAFFGVTARLDRLERAKLIEHRPDPKDRRGKLIALTDEGKRVIDETLGRHVANEQRVLSSLTTAEQERLNSLLKKLIAGL
jgi:DNA-binding MarR family transcriptional regulator